MANKIMIIVALVVGVGLLARLDYLEKTKKSDVAPVEDLFGDYIEYAQDVENRLKNNGVVDINDFEVLDLYQSIFDVQLQAAEKQNSKIFILAQKKFAQENGFVK